MSLVAVSFFIFLAGFLGIGIYSASRARGTRKDYYLASMGVHPAFVGLSAIATNNSGYMFIGVIGYTYATGVASVWLMLGWILGDFIASLLIHKKLRNMTGETGEATFAGIMARWGGTEMAVFRRVAALITLIFLGAYAAAQLNAGGKALQALFGWHPNTGAIMGSVIVVAYCIAGGIRASIWTDVAQSLVMLLAMGIMLTSAVDGLGGLSQSWHQMQAIPDYTNWFPEDLLFPGAAGMIMFALAWMFAGFSVAGQPHIMVRFMALDDAKNMVKARVYYYGFFIVFYAMATGVGLMSRLYLPELQSMDPELALPTMAMELLPAFMVGIVLAGIFAATMSTADSLVLSCSAALSHDLLPRRLEHPLEIKGATLVITVFALAIALSNSQSVFSLVILSWSTLASAFVPLLLVYALGRKVDEAQALLMMGAGVATAIIWRQLGWHNAVYEGMPGILVGLVIHQVIYSYHHRHWRRIYAPFQN